jgi:hypothetical protein
MYYVYVNPDKRSGGSTETFEEKSKMLIWILKFRMTEDDHLEIEYHDVQ